MTLAEWRRLPGERKGSWSEGLGTSLRAAHRVRVAMLGAAALTPVYLVDAARIDPAITA